MAERLQIPWTGRTAARRRAERTAGWAGGALPPRDTRRRQHLRSARRGRRRAGTAARGLLAAGIRRLGPTPGPHGRRLRRRCRRDPRPPGHRALLHDWHVRRRPARTGVRSAASLQNDRGRFDRRGRAVARGRSRLDRRDGQGEPRGVRGCARRLRAATADFSTSRQRSSPAPAPTSSRSRSETCSQTLTGPC